MKNKLQYAYSISVLMGVLLTSYLMMNREGNARIPLRTLSGPSLTSEATSLDPALSQLLEVENEISRISNEKGNDKKRIPSEWKQNHLR